MDALAEKSLLRPLSLWIRIQKLFTIKVKANFDEHGPLDVAYLSLGLESRNPLAVIPLLKVAFEQSWCFVA